MLTVTLEGLDELRAEWGQACTVLTRRIADDVDAAAKTGRGVARNLAPRRTGRLDNSIAAFVTSRGNLAAEAVLEAGASYASHVAYGTKAHAIRARRGGVLRFMSNGTPVFRRSVRHPGTAPNAFWERAYEATERDLQERTQRSADDFCRRLST